MGFLEDICTLFEPIEQARLRRLQNTLQDALAQIGPGTISERAVPCVRIFWSLPHIEPPYPVVKPREPRIDPSTITQSKLVGRLAVQFSSLSLFDRSSTPNTTLTRLERLPPELVSSIAEHLAFFDKKAFASTSQRIYHLLGLVEPPDRFAWRVHLMTSFNRVPCDHFDVTLFSPEQVRQELARIWRQIPKTPKRPHYKMDPMKSRLDDVNCLYFPTGFATKFRWRQIRCRTLGQFIAIQFNEYIDRLIKESDQGERLARKKRRIKQEIAHTDEDLEILDKDIKKWREINDQCFKGAHSEYDNVTWPPAMGRAAAPNCAVECSLEFMVRMGYELLWNRVCMHGKICELDEDEGIEIRRESTEPCRSTWHALDVLDEEEGYGSEWSDDETDHENKVNKPRAALDFFPEEYHASLLMGL